MTLCDGLKKCSHWRSTVAFELNISMWHRHTDRQMDRHTLHDSMDNIMQRLCR